ncbi:MAG: hypothetical protein QOD63_1559 [Actinomycetota bacterium]|jgi:hypothetical protein|nr:hypothetical protein [Actinomycetota bacterium]
MPGEDDLGWLPASGVHLSRDEVASIFGALRALVGGTDSDEPNRAHTVTIAFVIADAIERAGGAE